MYFLAHNCNPNGEVYEYIPDDWNNDLALLVFASTEHIKASDLVLLIAVSLLLLFLVTKSFTVGIPRA